MNNEIVKAIELKGIVHNATKIGTQDGQCEDIVNLRCKDGSWRTSGEGRLVYSMEDGSAYAQLFVHTNVYRHLLGVRDGKLYWFANIGADGVTFSNLTKPVEICSVSGDLFITPTGHLLTIIDEQKSYVYAVFSQPRNTYKVLNVDENGSVYDRKLYPFGEVHFNLDCNAKTYTEINEEAGYIDINGYGNDDEISINHNSKSPSYGGPLVPTYDRGNDRSAELLWHTCVTKAYQKALEDNRFTDPFMAVIALKLYDGSYIYASAPQMVYPRQKWQSRKMLSASIAGYDEFHNTDNKPLFYVGDGWTLDDNKYTNAGNGFCGGILSSRARIYTPQGYRSAFPGQLNIEIRDIYRATYEPIFTIGASTYSEAHNDAHTAGGMYKDKTKPMTAKVYGADLLLSIEDISLLLENKEIFTGVGVFITKPASVFDLSEEGHKKGTILYNGIVKRYQVDSGAQWWKFAVVNGSYVPQLRSDDEIRYDLMHSPFYLLREYSINELSNLQTSLRVDLSAPEYKGVLQTIEQQPTFSGDFNGRATYVPKVAYSYNQRLHIANYTKTLFHGYNIEQFMFNNHNGKVSQGSSDLGIMNFSATDEYSFYSDNDLVGKTYSNDEIITATIQVLLKTDDGDAMVSRVLDPKRVSGRTFIESLPPFVFYPDSRAYKMIIGINVRKVTPNVADSNAYAYTETSCDLKPHPVYNIAYGVISADMKPTLLYKLYTNKDGTSFPYIENSSPTQFTTWSYSIGGEFNATEDMPNAIKVSSTSNPFIFPARNTYQVGSSEIMALCSNAVAIGTGQTGAAPLYVFCKDGVYALLVDSSGEMVYTNSRIIARDVINQYNRATPIDGGVVFTTDRGLMSVSGSEVEELGQPLEGDYERFNLKSAVEYNHIAINSYIHEQLAGLSALSITKAEFLTFLKGAIVNYNHNERELMISNPNPNPLCRYSYILDRFGNWTRRTFAADEYVNNYPTSYRLINNNLYKTDEESDADNGMFVMSKVVKLDSIGFKELHRVVARGWFKTTKREIDGAETDTYLGLYVFGSYDGRKWACLGHRERTGGFTDIGTLVEHTDCRYFRFVLAGKLDKQSRFDYIEVSAKDSKLSTKIR